MMTEKKNVCVTRTVAPRVFSVWFDEYINNIIANVLSAVEHKYIL